jgi:hypothetical protein
MGGIDSNFDSDVPATNILIIEGRDGFFLFLLAANIDEAVALALSGLAPTPAHDASGHYIDASLGEEGGEGSIVSVEPEVSNKEHRLGGFAQGIFTFCARNSRSSGPFGPDPLGRITFRCGCRISRGLFTFSRGTFRLALKKDKQCGSNLVRLTTYIVLFLLFGFGRFINTRSYGLRFGLAISLSLSNLTRHSLAAASARLPLCLLLLLLLILLVGRLGNLDNYLATVELLLIKGLDSLLRGLCVGHSDKTIAR